MLALFYFSNYKPAGFLKQSMGVQSKRSAETLQIGFLINKNHFRSQNQNLGISPVLFPKIRQNESNAISVNF